MIALVLRLVHRFATGLRISMILALLTATASLTLWSQPAPQFPRSSTPPVTDDNAPNTKVRHDKISTKDVQEKLQKGLDSKNAAYAGSDIKVAADDQSVTLNGTVTSSIQHEMAMQLARAYAGGRKIVDKLSIR